MRTGAAIESVVGRGHFQIFESLKMTHSGVDVICFEFFKLRTERTCESEAFLGWLGLGLGVLTIALPVFVFEGGVELFAGFSRLSFLFVVSAVLDKIFLSGEKFLNDVFVFLQNVLDENVGLLDAVSYTHMTLPTIYSV